MPLSEQEQRLLEEMERSLYQNDSDFVARVTRRQGRASYTSITLGVLAALAGIAIVIVALVVKQPWLGLPGFVVMLAGVLYALRPGMRMPKSGAKAPKAGKASAGRSPRSSSGGSFMDRMNERWDKRNDPGQQ
ncbi:MULTISPECIES: DUF3040 domain-containing protein [Curtobacterium]|uniref:Membrane protein n=1 Tax=Curtobacterium oceanosedimentum TaxID=465820 RepID=A0A147DNE2_9MICO|nr:MULTISPECIES: DUF3040 domain-containing protein [Curtobacterium]KTR37402.1 membrane protein [Curtobacterium oceanosedimentum]KTR50911.1 membrane protein [Curtobacterium oceanosedimentum]UBQ03770.1 DUF3040 domain-containing protein [Curtobacterium sp. TXMA1]